MPGAAAARESIGAIAEFTSTHALMNGALTERCRARTRRCCVRIQLSGLRHQLGAFDFAAKRRLRADLRRARRHRGGIAVGRLRVDLIGRGLRIEASGLEPELHGGIGADGRLEHDGIFTAACLRGTSHSERAQASASERGHDEKTHGGPPVSRLGRRVARKDLFESRKALKKCNGAWPRHPTGAHCRPARCPS